MASRVETHSPAPDLSALLEALADTGVEFILVGGLAAVAQGAPITTIDVDIVHHRTPENIAKLLAFLRSICAHQRRPDPKVIEPSERDLAGQGHVLLSTQLGPLDVLAVIEEGRAYEDLFKDSVAIEFRGRTLRILKLETLIALKRTSKHPKDQQVVAILEETLKQLQAGSDEQ